MPILDQLEKEYSTSAKDWCQLRNGEDAKDRAHYISALLSKHKDYKERFLKVCGPIFYGDFLVTEKEVNVIHCFTSHIII